MSPTEPIPRIMPDIANEAKVSIAGALDWVGMNDIEIPILVSGVHGNHTRVPAKVTALVNLTRADARGIHMSRLYLQLDSLCSNDSISPASIRHLLTEFLDSHQGLSDSAMIKFDFDYMVRRPALLSDNSGWRRYPVTISGLLNQGSLRIELATQIIYSSTCPCSAALARQLIQEKFTTDFSANDPLDYTQVLNWLGSEEGICATPHSQRSSADIRVALAPSFANFPIEELVQQVEAALKTPVQTAVKREDEQEFARINGKNLMFCEDAARRIQQTLNDDDRLLDFWVRACHHESLHPHNAVAIVTKGLEGGFLIE